MALQLDLGSTPYGLPVSGAYVRITEIQIRDNIVIVKCDFFASQAARANNKLSLQQLQFNISNFDHSDPKPVKQKCYEALRGRPEFAGATDMLEPGQTA